MRTLTLLLLGPLLLACDEESEEIQPEPTATEESPAPSEPAAAPTPEAPTETANLTATVGQPAPDFELVDQSGTRHKLSDYRGKIVVLEWVCPTCPFVRRHYESGNMPRTAGSFPSDRVVWLAVDSSHFVTPQSSQEFRQANNLTYPVLQDPSGEVGQRYEARTTPHMYVIDTQGVLRYVGAIDDDPRGNNDSPTNYVQGAVQALLDGGQVPQSQTEPYGCTVKYENS